MPMFSTKSKLLLAECDHHLIAFFDSVIKLRDCTVLCGHRGQKEQDQFYANGTSKVKWPNGKHNKKPSMAVDVAPYFSNRAPGTRISMIRYEVIEFGYYCLGIRDAMNLTRKIRWGGDWDGNFLTLTDNEFIDAFHWEII
jgi:peptidoglycan L-alanyl-D-glutamate endopeptidase CwlK